MIMSSPMSLLSAFHFLILASLLASSVTAYTGCSRDGDTLFQDQSTYEANLNTLLSNLSAHVDQNGFYNTSVGQDPDRVNALVLCRGDAQLDECRVCVQNETIYLPQLCLTYRSREAIMWHEFCMLRYSDKFIYGTMESDYEALECNQRSSLNPFEFMKNLKTLLDNLRSQASEGSSLRKVAAGNISAYDSLTVFAMMQCTPDLSSDECNSCLETAAEHLTMECATSIGARLLMPSCNIRYEITPFYNVTRLEELGTLPMPPSSLQDSPPRFSQEPEGLGSRHSRTTWIIIILAILAVGSLIIGFFIGCFIRKRANQTPKKERELDDISTTTESLQYDFGVIRSATNDFSEANKLGQGGFGAVYKGRLPSGQVIAVKKLSGILGQGDLEFKNEVMLLAKVQNRNLVRLLGFSIEGAEKLLIYEFVQNASLDHFISDPNKRSHLDWNVRYNIIRGIARGMLYLHEDIRPGIIHRHLKSSNVLLDREMNPKIADFGMGRLFVLDETHISTSRIDRTYGYIAPEYATHGQFSIKSDVFSFGVLLLEIIRGQRNFCSRYEEIEDLIKSAWENWRNGAHIINFVDPVLRNGSTIQRDILKCIRIGMLCIQQNAADRPTMASVVIMLNSSLVTSPSYSETADNLQKQYGPENPLVPEFSSREANSNRPVNSERVRSGDFSHSEIGIPINEFYAR